MNRPPSRPRRRAWMAALGAACGLGLWFYFLLPKPLFRDPVCTVLFAREGQFLGAKIAADGQWRFPAADTCPARFAAAITVFEDKRFYHHPGLDPFAIVRAAWTNARAGKVVSGASTLSMQVIRLSRQGQARTWSEKIREAFLTLRLEAGYRKSDILALYASHAPFGGNVVGLSAAAWRYFGRGPEKLSWGEAALLAVLPNSPALIHPGRHRDALRRKRDGLLDQLQARGFFDKRTLDLAKAETLPPKPLDLPRLAPHLLERLAQENPNGATQAVSTLDFGLQSRVLDVLAFHAPKLAAQGIAHAAALVLHVPTGEVLAYAGNVDAPPGESKNDDGYAVDIITSRRSTGSLLKPFLFASLLSAGEILPGTLEPDIPAPLGGYAPQNFDRGYEGAVPARMALQRSLNVPSVYMLRDYGIERFLQTLRRLGMTTADRDADDYGLSLILGGAEGTLWELASLYAGLARETRRYASPDEKPGPSFFPAHYLRETDAAKRAIAKKAPPSAAPIDPAGAWLTLQTMADLARPDQEKYWRSFSSSRWVAWKTGTSFGFRDAWAIGVTPEYVAAVWVGNASGQGRPGMTGMQAAAPLLFDIYDGLPATTLFPRPMHSLMRIPVCRQSGMRPSPHCPQTDSVWIPRAGLHTPPCPYHTLVHLAAKADVQVHDGCESVTGMRHQAWFVLPPAQEWFYRQRHSDYLPLPPWRPDCETSQASPEKNRAMALLYPRGPGKIYLPKGFGGQPGSAVFKAVHRNPKATVYWYLDQDFLGETIEFHQLEVRPEPGRHRLLLIDDQGERLENVFEVLAR